MAIDAVVGNGCCDWRVHGWGCEWRGHSIIEIGGGEVVGVQIPIAITAGVVG